ncbi:DUF4198 domain-containing protein [Bremerella alba]|uniref:Carboxypeptidase regulatory-like domain-containing protein n=1 Tax=Bremerella alba TaxID=980252 RepID=A0A7V9A689_9BACT|nr:DUF4198 domain-containing protein [Bremerella alba]MBA2114140.1 hypothetical protein [Bremerella alba]
MQIIHCSIGMLCLIFLIAGCSSESPFDMAPVTGTVLYQGKPLPYGNINFRPLSGSPAFSRIDSNGTFTLSTYGDRDGAIVGKHEVLIKATDIDAGKPPRNNSGIEMPVLQSVIPKKYTSFATSELTVEVVAGNDNHFVFELEE